MNGVASPPPWQNPRRQAEAQQQPEAGQASGHVDVESVPVLTRLMASQEATELAGQQLQSFQGKLSADSALLQIIPCMHVHLHCTQAQEHATSGLS